MNLNFLIFLLGRRRWRRRVSRIRRGRSESEKISWLTFTASPLIYLERICIRFNAVFTEMIHISSWCLGCCCKCPNIEISIRFTGSHIFLLLLVLRIWKCITILSLSWLFSLFSSPSCLLLGRYFKEKFFFNHWRYSEVLRLMQCPYFVFDSWKQSVFSEDAY